ncbi:MAG: argininosuccinate lyase [Thaumarchaeota archaeon]|nr:argininosuccinate lyase [Nitrososphaerota archaeon]
MYRSRLKGRLDKNVLSYMSSINDDLLLLDYDILGSQAHSIMLYEQKLIKKSELKKILDALDSAKKKDLRKLAFEYEDIHEALEAFVVKKAGIEAGGKMHTARSRNDQVALDIRMKARDDINNISIQVIDLINKLLFKASQNKDSIMPMYTHLQHAQIGTFSHYLLSYSDMLLRDLERLNECYERVNKSPLGTSAIGGSSIKIDRKKTASLLSFSDIVENSIDATTSRDTIIELCFHLSMIMIDLSRVAEDFILWSSSEFDYIELADELTSSSSVMPQKKNPCPLELMRAKTAHVIGLVFSIMAMVKALPSGYSRDLQDTKHVLFRAITITSDSLNIMGSVIETLYVNKKTMLKSAENSYAISLDIAEELVRNGMVFRKAHKVVGELVRVASRTGKNLCNLTENEIRNVAGKELTPLISKIIKNINPKHSVQSRVSVGSPNPKEQIRMIKDRKRKVNGYKLTIEKRSEHVHYSFENLERIVKSF